jgi:hypothetical protein
MIFFEDSRCNVEGKVIVRYIKDYVERPNKITISRLKKNLSQTFKVTCNIIIRKSLNLKS